MAKLAAPPRQVQAQGHPVSGRRPAIGENESSAHRRLPLRLLLGLQKRPPRASRPTPAHPVLVAANKTIFSRARRRAVKTSLEPDHPDRSSQQGRSTRIASTHCSEEHDDWLAHTHEKLHLTSCASST
ncbi:signal recognition particle receptor beta subunit [Colletotrichum higginsianum]|nr:signal recognition particle receptor beta subunit [Colletotrichum higginsianum]